jgi:hypothetical protein
VLRQSLEGTARDLRIESSVRFAGWRRDLRAVYGAMDVVALRRRLGANGREVARRFRSERLVADIAAVYSALLTERSSRRVRAALPV